MVLKKSNVSTIIRQTVFLAILSLNIFMVQSAHALEGASDSTRIQATPFDYKLSQAGFFKEKHDYSQSIQHESVDNLFLKARSFRYVHDSRQNRWQSHQETEAKHIGDCKDKALWLYAELKKNGYTHLRFVIGKYRSFDKLFHAWLLYTDNSNITYLLDPVVQKRAWKETDISGGFYKPFYSFDGKTRYRHAA